MNSPIKPLLVHPPPARDDTIAKWLVDLARVNNIPFRMFFAYIMDCAKYRAFFQILSDLTRVPIEILTGMCNEFKDRFWEDPCACPVMYCDYKSRSPTDVFQHLRKTHEIGVVYFPCPHCAFKAKERKTLEIHVKLMHEIHVVIHECKFCDYKTKRNADLDRHQETVHGVGVHHSCGFCDYQSIRVKDWFDHLRYEHGVWTILRFDPTRSDDGYHCPYCESIMESRSELTSHVKLSHEERGTTACPHCRFTSMTRKEHSKHLREKHALGNWYKCNLCGFKNKDKRMLKWHLSNKHDIGT